MERHGGKRITQELFKSAFELLAAIHAMEVESSVKFRKFRACHEHVSPAGKVRPHFNARVYGIYQSPTFEGKLVSEGRPDKGETVGNCIMKRRACRASRLVSHPVGEDAQNRPS